MRKCINYMIATSIKIVYFYAVKFIALFLSIIVVSLTAMPCCTLEERQSHAHEITQKHECSEQDDDCCKDCSPFYVCGTCIGFTFTTQQVVSFAIPLKPVQHNTIYIPVELQAIPVSIWQPPKLS